MRRKLIPYELQNSITTRLSALSDLHTALQRAEQNEKAVFYALLDAVPKSLLQFVDDVGVINSLLKYGHCSTCIDFKQYSFKNFAAAKKAVLELKRAWAKQVAVHLGAKPEPDRVDIHFGIAQF